MSPPTRDAFWTVGMILLVLGSDLIDYAVGFYCFLMWALFGVAAARQRRKEAHEPSLK